MFSFREVLISDTRMILNWRIKKRISDYMISDIDYNEEAQSKWIEKTYLNRYYYHWVILLSGHPIGLIYLSNFNVREKKTSWGFYIGDDDYLGYGGLAPPYLYNYCFNNLNLSKIESEIFSNNLSVIKLHKLYGYESTDNKKKTIYKKNKIITINSMELTRINFDFKKYKKCNANFDTKLWRVYI